MSGRLSERFGRSKKFTEGPQRSATFGKRVPRRLAYEKSESGGYLFPGTAWPMSLSVRRRLTCGNGTDTYRQSVGRSDVIVLSARSAQASVMQEASDFVAELQRILGHRIVTRAGQHCDFAAGNA